MTFAGVEPPENCRACPRLAGFREDNRHRYPDFFNDPVPCFGPVDARLLIAGLAPGLKGANRTGRVFTGDYAGDLLYDTLIENGFARGTYRADPNDGLEMVDCRITNVVRCVPPQNQPTASEISTCRAFFAANLTTMTRLEAILALGRIAHESVIRALGERLSRHPFAHGAQHRIGRLSVFDSYHCSRYNTNTGRLTPEMFRAVLAKVQATLT